MTILSVTGSLARVFEAIVEEDEQRLAHGSSNAAAGTTQARERR